MTQGDWLLSAVALALVVVLTVLVMLWEDKRTLHSSWNSVFYRAPMTWREYAAEKKNLITSRLGKKQQKR